MEENPAALSAIIRLRKSKICYLMKKMITDTDWAKDQKLYLKVEVAFKKMITDTLKKWFFDLHLKVTLCLKKNDYYDWAVSHSEKNEQQLILAKEPRAPRVASTSIFE